jgi:hypothetical protein
VPGGWRDRVRRYQVIIDGERVAMIKRGQRIDLPVTPGRHVIFLQIEWARSPQLDVDVPRARASRWNARQATSGPSVRAPQATSHCDAPPSVAAR